MLLVIASGVPKSKRMEVVEKNVLGPPRSASSTNTEPSSSQAWEHELWPPAFL